MTVNAIAFYAVAVLIVLAAAAAVGLPSLRLAAFAGGAVVVLMAVLDLVSSAYALAVIEIVVPAAAVAVVFLVLRQQGYRGLAGSSSAPRRWRIAGPVAVALGAVLVVTLSLVGMGWYPGPGPRLDIHYFAGENTALVTVFHYRAPYALAIGVVLVVITIAAGLVIGRRSGDEETLDHYLQSKREREERARRRRDDREQGRKHPTRGAS